LLLLSELRCADVHEELIPNPRIRFFLARPLLSVVGFLHLAEFRFLLVSTHRWRSG